MFNTNILHCNIIYGTQNMEKHNGSPLSSLYLMWSVCSNVGRCVLFLFFFTSEFRGQLDKRTFTFSSGTLKVKNGTFADVTVFVNCIKEKSWRTLVSQTFRINSFSEMFWIWAFVCDAPRGVFLPSFCSVGVYSEYFLTMFSSKYSWYLHHGSCVKNFKQE